MKCASNVLSCIDCSSLALAPWELEGYYYIFMEILPEYANDNEKWKVGPLQCLDSIGIFE